MDSLVPSSEDPIQSSNLVDSLKNLFQVERQFQSLKNQRQTTDNRTLTEAKEK